MTEIEIEKIKDTLLDIRRKRVTPIESFNADLTEHFTSALAAFNVPKHIILELTGYAALRANILTCDAVNREYRRWNREQKKLHRKGVAHDG
jgi:hypothetical protein